MLETGLRIFPGDGNGVPYFAPFTILGELILDSSVVMGPDIEKFRYMNLIKRQIPHILMPITGCWAQV